MHLPNIPSNVVRICEVYHEVVDLSKTGATLTVTGTDDQGRTISEDVAGNATTASTVLDYKTVTSITIDMAANGAIIVGTSGVGASAPIPLDQYLDPFNVTIQALIAAGATVDGTVQYTVDDVFDGVGPFNWVAFSATLTAFTATAIDTAIAPITAIRLLTNSGTDAIQLNVIQAGAL